MSAQPRELTEQEKEDNALWEQLEKEQRESDPLYETRRILPWVSDPFQLACLFYGMAGREGEDR